MTGQVRPPASRPLSLEELRAAVAAVRGGTGLGRLVEHGESSGASIESLSGYPWVGAAAGGRLVLVLSGHAGAGASTVAVALAEGLVRGRKARIVEYAEPRRSGLASASSIELGVDGSWRRGRRGGLDVFRLAEPAAIGPASLPPAADGGDGWLVVDAGERLTADWIAGADGTRPQIAHLVVVTRLTVPAVRQTERVLEAVGVNATVAAVGPSRWPRSVRASCGPLLRDLRSRGRIVRIPLDRRLSTSGVTGDPLPSAVAAAGRSLAALLAPQPRPQHRHRQQAVPPQRGPAGAGR